MKPSTLCALLALVPTLADARPPSVGDEIRRAVSSRHDSGEATPASRPTTCPVPDGGYARGTVAPDMVLVDQNGQRVSLSNYRDRRVILDFCASWCFPCRIMAAGVTSVMSWAQQRGVDLVYLTVITEDEGGTASDRFDALRWAAQFNNTGTVLHDNGDESVHQCNLAHIAGYSATAGAPGPSYPTIVLLDRGNVILDAFAGSRPVGFFAQLIDGLAGLPPSILSPLPNGEPTPLGTVAVTGDVPTGMAPLTTAMYSPDVALTDGFLDGMLVAGYPVPSDGLWQATGAFPVRDTAIAMTLSNQGKKAPTLGGATPFACDEKTCYEGAPTPVTITDGVVRGTLRLGSFVPAGGRVWLIGLRVPFTKAI